MALINEAKGKRIGIALGGGGARGFAHAGVLKILEEAGIPLHVVVGTSMGAIIGALFIQQGSVRAAIRRLQQTLRKRDSSALDFNAYTTNDHRGDHFLDYVSRRIQRRIIINLSITRKSLLSSTRLERVVDDLIDDCNTQDLPIRFAAMASDLKSGKGVILRNGSLRRSLIASSSIPAFFPPVKWNDLLLVDGEVTDLVPVEACYALGADFVIAVDVTRDLEPMPELNHTIDVFLRSARITGYHYTEVSLKKADFVLRPIQEDVQWSDFQRLPELIAAGEWATRRDLPDLKKALANADPDRPRFTSVYFDRIHLDSEDLQIGGE